MERHETPEKRRGGANLAWALGYIALGAIAAEVFID